MADVVLKIDQERESLLTSLQYFQPGREGVQRIYDQLVKLAWDHPTNQIVAPAPSEQGSKYICLLTGEVLIKETFITLLNDHYHDNPRSELVARLLSIHNLRHVETAYGITPPQQEQDIPTLGTSPSEQEMPIGYEAAVIATAAYALANMNLSMEAMHVRPDTHARYFPSALAGQGPVDDKEFRNFSLAPD
jgi:hypothetical protein